jgi:hypothetical protein
MRPRRSPQPFDCVSYFPRRFCKAETGDPDQGRPKGVPTTPLEVLQPVTTHAKLAQVVATATRGCETPHEFGLAHCVRGRGPAAATFQAHKCRRSVAPRGVQPVERLQIRSAVACRRPLSPVADRATRHGRCRIVRGGNENHGLPLFVSCRQPRVAST